MTYAEKLIDKLGGARSLAKEIGKSPSTVASWKARGAIPDDAKLSIWQAAKRADVTIGPSDFLPFDADEHEQNSSSTDPELESITEGKP